MVDQIILVGPLCVGKTTVSNYLKKIAGLPYVSTDAVMWYYHTRNGVDVQEAQALREIDAFQYLNSTARSNSLAMRRIVTEFKGIIDCGASHTYCLRGERDNGIAELIQGRRSVSLTLSRNVAESAAVLNERLRSRLRGIGRNESCISSWCRLNEEMLESGRFQQQAHAEVVCGNLNPQAIAEKIWETVKTWAL